MHDLYSTDPTQDTCNAADLADYTAPIRQRELDHAVAQGFSVAFTASLNYYLG